MSCTDSLNCRPLVPALLCSGLLLLAGSLRAQPVPELLRSYQGTGGMGWAVADIADLDGDGHRDFIAGAQSGGRVFALSSATSAPIWNVAPGVRSLGWAVSSAGDINADGVVDVVAGAPNATPVGRVLVLSGRDGSVLLDIASPADGNRFGYAVSSLEDLNGDGVPELLVGAAGGRGRAYVLSGSDGQVLRNELGASGIPGAEFGAGIARLQDVDGDGVEDYVVGAPGELGGRAHVYSGANGALLHSLSPTQGNGRFGEFFVADAGDVDGDGSTDVYVGAYAETGGNGAAYVFSGATGARIHRIGGTPGEGLGPGRGAGDVDGDGRADLAVGAYTYSGAGITQGGRVGIFSGRDLRFLMRVNGNRGNGQFGFDTVGVGDINDDGRLDFIVASSPVGAVDLFAGVVDRPLIPSGAAVNLGDTWWTPAEPGWGLDLLHQDDLIFATWYSYAPEDGGVMFLTIQANATGEGRFAGPIFRVRGIPLGQFNGTQAFTSVEQIGEAELLFASAGELQLDYTLFGVSQSKSLVPFRFDPGAPVCWGDSASRAGLQNHSDLWWNPLESGWGLTLAEQGDVLFALWYTYGEGGREQWLSAARMLRQPDGSFAGALQRPQMGTPLPLIDGPATDFPIADVGSATVRFSDGENGVFSYNVDGLVESKRIRRFVAVAGNGIKRHCGIAR